MKSLLRVMTLASLLLHCGLSAADSNYDFWISEKLLQRVEATKSALFTLDVEVHHRSALKKPAEDCEMHLASEPTETGLASPDAFVVEPPYLCKNSSPTGEKWEDLVDQKVLDKKCRATGFFRILDEHLRGNASDSNPHHMLEIHPVVTLTCGDMSLAFTEFLKYHNDMKSMKATSATSCFDMAVRIRRNTQKKRVEFQVDRAQTCGNFMKHEMSVFGEWIRAIGTDGGHSAIARVKPAGSGANKTLKIYTLPGTPEDSLLETWRKDYVAGKGAGHHGAKFHGMTTIDHFAVWKVITDKSGHLRSVPEWKDVPYPLALVVMGTADDGNPDGDADSDESGSSP